MTEKTEKEIKRIVRDCDKGIEKLEKIYDDFDIMNMHLHNLTEVLDEEKYPVFFHMWKSFPTYSTLDSLKQELEEIKADMETEKNIENK